MLDTWGLPLLWSEPLSESECEHLGTLLEKIEPDDAIVHYPVTIAGRSHTKENVPHHITLRWGKWDGSRIELANKVKEALDGLPLTKPAIKTWHPQIFRGKDGDKEFKVLTIPVTPQLKMLRDALSQVFGPDPFPEFKPHITVDSEIWDEIKKEHLLPGDIGCEVHPLEVAMGNSTIEILG